MSYLRQFLEALLYPLRALLSSPGRMSSSARKMVAISLPARIAILTAVFLVLAAIAGYFMFETVTERRSFYLSPSEWFVVVALIFAIPIVLYYALKLWLEGDLSRYPDIDYAWKAGLAELRVHGLELEYTPLFLVLGSPGELHEKSLFNAAQLPLRIREIPTGAAALHWFAEPNGIYLVCTEVGCLSKLAAMAKRAGEESQAQGGKVHQSAGPASIRGTMVLDQGAAPSQPLAASQAFPAPGVAQSTSNIRGTMVISSDSMGASSDDSVAPADERKPVLLSQEVQREQELRLEYLCRLIAKARQPLAPVNGVLTLLPFSIVQAGRREGSELYRLVKRDLNNLVRSLKLRCPVSSLVIGMEEESGFREMVRRVGREAAMAQRFGKGFSVGNPPIPEQLEAVAAHACGLYEAKIYELFREKGSLSKPGNTKLYALLCKIRRMVRTPLTNILVNGYAHDPDTKNNGEPAALFFSGCYFAATGESDDRQAFIKAVFDKLPAEQEELEWTEAALQQEERYRGWSQTIMWFDAILLASIVGMILYKLIWA